MKLMMDFIYYGETVVNNTDVASLLRTAEFLEMTSLYHSVSHGFGEEISWNEASVRSVNMRCSVSCMNLKQNYRKNLLEDQVPHDPAILYDREEILHLKSQNIERHSLADSSTKYFKNFQYATGKDEQTASIADISNSFKEITKQDKENVNDELLPLNFVAVLPVLETEEPNEGHQDKRMVLNAVLKDPLGECYSIFDIIEERSVKKECTSQSELQVKNEPKEDNDVPDLEITDDVFVDERLTHSGYEVTDSKCKSSQSYDQDNDTKSNRDIILRDTFCSEGCASEETHNLEIKFENICEISGTEVKEEKVFKTGQCLNHIVGDDTGTCPLEPESELLESDVQHSTSIDNQQDVNGGGCDPSSKEISSPFSLEIGNKIPGFYEAGAQALLDLLPLHRVSWHIFHFLDELSPAAFSSCLC